MTKEIEAGIVDAAEYELTTAELEKVLKTMDETFATEAEVAEASTATRDAVEADLPSMIRDNEEVHKAIEQNVDTIKYKCFTD
jgi:hypothetical protein